MNNKFNNFKNKINNRFLISQRNSTLKTETVGGVVNFMVLVYAMVVIPNIIAGNSSLQLWNAIYLATLLSIIFATIFMAFNANLPLVSAPGLGLTSYFATLIANGTYTYNQTITIAFIAGVVFILLTLVGFRKALIKGLPKPLVLAIPAGIGLFILNIGLSSNQSGLLDFINYGPNYLVNNQPVFYSALVALIGFISIIIMQHKQVKGAIFYGILISTGVYFVFQLIQGINPFEVLQQASWLPPFKDLFNQSFFKFDFKGTFVKEGVSIISSVLGAVIIIFSYTLVDLFDTVGTLFGATKGTNLINEKGEIYNANRVFWVDSSSTIFGAVFGVPGCTVYVESIAGIKTGARTGFSALISGLLFVFALFLSPLFVLIPSCATAPALIYVGISMFSSVLEIDFSKLEQLIPAIFTIIIMPLTNNITFGIGVGLIMYSLIMLLTKQGKKVNLITYILAILFIIFFATQNLF